METSNTLDQSDSSYKIKTLLKIKVNFKSKKTNKVQKEEDCIFYLYEDPSYGYKHKGFLINHLGASYSSNTIFTLESQSAILDHFFIQRFKGSLWGIYSQNKTRSFCLSVINYLSSKSKEDLSIFYANQNEQIKDLPLVNPLINLFEKLNKDFFLISKGIVVDKISYKTLKAKILPYQYHIKISDLYKMVRINYVPVDPFFEILSEIVPGFGSIRSVTQANKIKIIKKFME